MDNFLNEQSIKIFSSKLYAVLNYTLPGIFTLDIFFKKGLFSTPPQTIFEFILLILWSFIFSIPFNLLDAFSVKNVYIKVKNEIKKKGILNEESEKEFYKTLEEDNEKHNELDSITQFISIIIYLIFIYFTYKYLVSHYNYEVFWEINKTFLIYLNTLLFYPICYFFIYLIGKVFEKILANKLLKELYDN